MAITIQTEDMTVARILQHLAHELPGLLASGETWRLTINNTRDGRIIRQIETSAPVELAPPAKRRVIERR